MKNQLKNKITSTTIVLTILILLWFALTLNQTKQAELIFPSPKLVISTLIDNWSDILVFTLTTWYRVLIGLLIGTFLGVLFGVFMTYSRFLYNILDPIIEIIRPIPPIALTPFFILWFGLGDISQFLLISLGCFMIIVVSTYVGITNVSPIFTRSAQSLGATKMHLYKTVFIPAIIPGLLSGIRVALASSFALTVAAEYLGAQGGLGYLIRNARQILHTETILLAAIILGILSLLTDQIIRMVFNSFTKWTPKSF